MSKHLQRQIDKLKRLVLDLGDLVLRSFEQSIQAVKTQDATMAKRVIDLDNEIDQMEIEVEEECLHTLALYQPVAWDLRYVVAVLKINNDLERIGDLATNIAEQALTLAEELPIQDWPFDIDRMSGVVRQMLQDALDALVNVDTAVAERVRAADDEVDAIHAQVYQTVQSRIREEPHRMETLVRMLSVSRYLERIADHAENIAEDVLYTSEGEIFRHKAGRFRAAQ